MIHRLSFIVYVHVCVTCNTGLASSPTLLKLKNSTLSSVAFDNSDSVFKD
jgi:hypothetical protein